MASDLELFSVPPVWVADDELDPARRPVYDHGYVMYVALYERVEKLFALAQR